jgi:hypothetical protein
MLDTGGHGDSFNYLAFNQNTGEILSHGHKAIFALARADLREPDEPIEILNAGIAGKRLWHNRTPLPLARQVLDQLAESWKWDPPQTAAKLHLN